MESPAPGSSSLLGSLRGFADGLLGSVQDRIQLFAVELQEEKFRLIQILLWVSGLMLLAIATSRASITDPLAIWFVAARGVQSCVHLISGSVIAVNIRFTAFAIQMIIGTIWAWKLLVALA